MVTIQPYQVNSCTIVYKLRLEGYAILSDRKQAVRKYFGQDISFVDCAGFVAAKKVKAGCILLFDDYFQVMGLDVQPFLEKKGRERRREDG